MNNHNQQAPVHRIADTPPDYTMRDGTPWWKFATRMPPSMDMDILLMKATTGQITPCRNGRYLYDENDLWTPRRDAPTAPTVRPEQALRTFADKLLNAQPNPPDIARAISENLMELVEPTPATATPRTFTIRWTQQGYKVSIPSLEEAEVVYADDYRTLERELAERDREIAIYRQTVSEIATVAGVKGLPSQWPRFICDKWIANEQAHAATLAKLEEERAECVRVGKLCNEANDKLTAAEQQVAELTRERDELRAEIRLTYKRCTGDSHLPLNEAVWQRIDSVENDLAAARRDGERMLEALRELYPMAISHCRENGWARHPSVDKAYAAMQPTDANPQPATTNEK